MLYQSGDVTLERERLKDVSSFGLEWQLRARLDDWLNKKGNWPPQGLDCALHVHLHTHIHTHAYIFTYIHAYMYICTYIFHTYTYIHIHTYKHTHTYT